MNVADLYREEVFTDRRIGSIRCLIPVKADGKDDPKRSKIYVGQAQILTEMGALPLSFEIDAQSLEQAVARFSKAAEVAVQETSKELQELRRQASSSIVVPDMAAGGPPGMPPRGGKIQLP